MNPFLMLAYFFVPFVMVIGVLIFMKIIYWLIEKL